MGINCLQGEVRVPTLKKGPLKKRKRSKYIFTYSLMGPLCASIIRRVGVWFVTSLSAAYWYWFGRVVCFFLHVLWGISGLGRGKGGLLAHYFSCFFSLYNWGRDLLSLCPLGFVSLSWGGGNEGIL